MVSIFLNLGHTGAKNTGEFYSCKSENATGSHAAAESQANGIPEK